MLRIIQDGENRFRLETAQGHDIGWIHGRSLGFRGLSSEAAAIDAAIEAARALDVTLLREFPGRTPQEIRASRVRLVHDGAWWVRGLQQVAIAHFAERYATLPESPEGEA